MVTLLKKQLRLLLTLKYIFILILTSCGGGGGGIGGGLIPSFQSFNVNALLPNTAVDLNDYLDGATGPYTMTIISGPGSVDNSGNVTANAGAGFDVIIVGITDSRGDFVKIRVPIIGNPINWLQAEDVTTSAIAQWPDSASGGYATADCGALTCPSLSPNTLNEKKLIAFDGVDDRMTFNATGFRDDHTAFVLFKSDTGSESGTDWFQKSAILSSYDGDIGDYDFGIGLDSIGRVFCGYRHLGGTENFYSVANYTDAKGHITTITRDQVSGNFRQHIDGIQRWAAGSVTSPLTGSPTVSFSIGSQHDNSNFFEGEIGEIILYDDDLSDSQRQIVERYLKDKFDLDVDPSFMPTIAINTVPADPTNGDLAFGYTVTPSAFFDIVSIECRLNGSWHSCTGKTKNDYFGMSSIVETATYNGVADGAYTFEIRATDSDGRIATNSYSSLVDSTPPSCSITFPIDTSYVADATPSATFSCNDNNAIITYQCDINDADVWAACTSSTTQVFAGLSTDDVTKLEVRAQDQYGQWSTIVSTTWTTDLVDPVCAFTTTPSLIQDGAAASFVYSCSDNNPFPGNVECSVDGGLFVSCGSDTNFDLTGLTSGAHSLVIRVTDVAGTIETSSHNWTSDLLTPTCSFDPLFDGTNYDNNPNPTLTFSCSDDNTITNNVQCSLNGGVTSDCTTNTSSALTGLAEGAHSLEISTTDIAGKSDSDTFNWNVDLTDPTCSFTSEESGEVNNPNAHFEYNCSDPTSGGVSSGIDKIECSFDGGAYIDCDSHSMHDYYGIADGAHTLKVQPIDLAGNIGAYIEASWTTAATPPTVSSNYSDATYASSIFLELTPSKTASIYYCISTVSTCDPTGEGILYVNPIETSGANATYNISYYAIDLTAQESIGYSQNFVINRFEFSAPAASGALTINGNGVRKLSGDFTEIGFFRNAAGLGTAITKGTSQNSQSDSILEQGFNELAH